MATQKAKPGPRATAIRRSLVALAGMLMGLLALAGASPAMTRRANEPVDFAHDIAPLIKAHCAECHTDGKYKGSFSLDTRESMLKSEAIVAGKSGESELLERITSADPEFRMPPKGNAAHGRRGRTARGLDRPGVRLAGWVHVQAGRLSRPAEAATPRTTRGPRGRDHPIDRIIDAYFARARSSRPTPLDDAAFARRLFLDVIGLLPPPEELEAFANDPAPDKRARLARRFSATAVRTPITG